MAIPNLSNEDLIKLGFEVDTKQVAEATAAIDKLEKSVKKTADTYDVLERQVGEYEVLERRVTETVKEAAQKTEELNDASKKLDTTYQQLRDNTKQLQAQQKELSLAFQSGKINANEFTEKSTLLTNQIRENHKTLDAANISARNMGMGMLSASYAVQDFTSQLGTRGLAGALAAVQNNIPGILMGMGAGAGVTAAISAASMAVGALYENWDKLAGLWSSKDVAMTAQEIADAMEKQAESAKKLLETPTKAEKSTAELVSAAIVSRKTELPSMVEAGLAKKTPIEDYIMPADKQAWEALQTHPGDFADPAGARRAILERAAMNRKQAAVNLIGQLPTDRRSRDLLRGMGPGIFGRGFLTELDLAEPEAQVDMKREIEAETAAGKEMQTTRDQMKAKIKADKEEEKAQDYANKLLKKTIADEARETASAAAQKFAFEQQREAETRAAQAKADAAAKKAIEDRRPSHVLAKQRQEQDDMILNELQQRDQQNQMMGGPAATPEFYAMAKAKAQELATGGVEIGRAIEIAIYATNAKNKQDVLDVLSRLSGAVGNNAQNMNGYGVYNPTPVGRGAW